MSVSKMVLTKIGCCLCAIIVVLFISSAIFFGFSRNNLDKCTNYTTVNCTTFTNDEGAPCCSYESYFTCDCKSLDGICYYFDGFVYQNEPDNSCDNAVELFEHATKFFVVMTIGSAIVSSLIIIIAFSIRFCRCCNNNNGYQQFD